MITIKEIFDFLCDKYPLETATAFDNPGFLVGDMNKTANKVLVCLDCTFESVESALANNCSLIITHHPVIFDPLKSVTKGSVVYELLSNHISVISMHTNLDMGEGGVNDCLCKALELKNIEVFEGSDGFKLRCAVSPEKDPDRLAEHIKKCLNVNVRYVAGRDINKLLICSGSGGNFIEDAINNGFDGLITADVKHNLFLQAQAKGISLFDAGHYHTEQVIIEPLCQLLKGKFNCIEFIPHQNSGIKTI